MQDNLVCTLRLFADDALLYHKISHDDDTLALQRDLDKLGLWANRWQILFNPTNCYKMSVYRSRSPGVKDYTLYNQALVTVQQHHYLGVLLSSDLWWNSCGQECQKGEFYTYTYTWFFLLLCTWISTLDWMVVERAPWEAWKIFQVFFKWT